SARAASPALPSISPAIRASMVCAAMMRQAVTGSACPMRWLRSMAWVCSASVQDSSASTMFEATCRFRPTPAAVSEHTATVTSGSFTKASTFACRAAGQLRRIVRGQFGLRLADASHHGEHVLAGLLSRRVLQLRPGHPADEVVVDTLDAGVGGSVRERGLVLGHHPAGEVLLGCPDRPADPSVQFDGEVGDAAGGDVGGH